MSQWTQGCLIGWAVGTAFTLLGSWLARWWFGVLVLALLLPGCALSPVREARTITLTVEQARATYATATTLYRTLYLRLAPLCAGGEASSALPLQLGQPLAPDCQRLAQIHREFQKLDFEIQRALDHPGVEIDWARVEDLLRLVVDLAIP